MKKKDLPLSVLKTLEPFVDLHGDMYVRVEEENSLIKFRDFDEESDFHFTINEYRDNKFLITYKPFSKNNLDPCKISISHSEIEKHFKTWISLLEEYLNVKSVYDDPILKSFEDEFFTDFEILDEDKEKPLENDKIFLLDEYLSNLSNGLEKHKTEENSNKINEIQSNIVLLQENLTNNSRQEIASKISKIFAKIKKLGIKYFKEFITEGKKQLISKGVKFLIENGPKILEEINKIN
ncbi:MAG: hypothetical protein ACOVNP_07070 [Flavobacterium sp.]